MSQRRILYTNNSLALFHVSEGNLPKDLVRLFFFLQNQFNRIALLFKYGLNDCENEP